MGEIRFDPYTGEPVAPKAAPEAPAPTPKKKGGKGGILAGIIAALVVVGGIFVVTRFIGNPGTPYSQIKKAAEKALVQDQMTEQFNEVRDIMGDGTYAVDGAFDVGGQKVKVKVDTDKGDLSAKISAAGLGGTVYMDGEKITVDGNKLGLGVMCYDYASDKDKTDSYFGAMVGPRNLQAADIFLKMFHTAAGMDKKTWEEIQDLIDEKCETLEYEELEIKDRNINYSSYKCDGFSTTVSGEFLADLLDDVSEKAFGKSLTDLSDELASLGIYSDDATGVMAQLREIDDIELTFFIDDDKVLRQIAFKSDTDEQNIDATLSFAGEKIPWHDTVFKDNNSDFYIDWGTAQSGDDNTYELVVFSYKRFSIEYEDDDLDFTFYDSNGNEELGGTLENEKGKVTIEFQDLPDKYTDGKIVISDDCSVAEAPAAEDVLNMSQEDLAKLGRIIYQLMYGY